MKSLLTIKRHQKTCTGAKVMKPSPVKKHEPRMPIRTILTADDLSVDLSAALINDSQLTESLSMVINTDQLRVSYFSGFNNHLKYKPSYVFLE